MTDAFSKKVENHAYAVALHMMYDIFVRMHQKLRDASYGGRRFGPIWEIGDIAKLVEDAEGPPKKRGPYER